MASASLALLLSVSVARADDDAEPEESVEEKPRGRFEIGVGYNPDDDFVATAAVVQDDLFRSGFGLSLTARLSSRRQLFLMRFADHRVFDTDLSLTADVYNDMQQWTEFSRQAVGGALSLSHPLGEHTRGFIGYRLEDVTLETGVFDRGGAADTDPLLRDGLLSAIRAGISHDTRDNPVFPTTGTTAGAYIELADPGLGSDIEFAKVGGWASRHGRLVGPLSLHTRVGVDGIWNQSGGPVPLTERLRLGGHRDIRGYGINTTDELGGNVKFTSQTELELTLSNRYGLSAVAFFDAGGVWNLDRRSCQVAALSTGPIDPCAGASLMSGLRESVGFGLVWRSPIGPLRLDWAIPLNRRPGQSAMEFLFSFGGVF